MKSLSFRSSTKLRAALSLALSKCRRAQIPPNSNARKNVTTHNEYRSQSVRYLVCLFLFIYNLFVYYPLFLILFVLVEALSGADSGLSLIDFFFQCSGNLSLYAVRILCGGV